MKTKTTILAILGVLILGVGVTSVALIALDGPKTPAPQPQEQTTQPTENQNQENTVRFTAEPDKNVLEQLASHAAIETKDSQYGVYVDTINGKKGGEGGKYWTFYVDGEMSQVGAAAYVTKGGEIIEWKFE